MAASITPDPFVPSGHYRVRSPSQIRRDFGERNSSRRPLEGLALCQLKRGLSGAQLDIDSAGAQPLSEIVAVASKRVPAARTGNLGRPSLSSSARWPDLARMLDDFSS